MNKFLKNAALVLAVTISLLAVIEISVRLFLPQSVDTTYYVGETLALKNPVTGHVNRPKTRAVLSAPEFEVEYIVNARGFRSAALDDTLLPSPDAVKVLLLGDSFVFGAANHFENIWPEVLAKRYENEDQNVEIINAGVPGYDTSQQALYLETLFETYQPDIVVLTFLPNDLFANRPIETENGQDNAHGDARAVVKSGVGKKSHLHSLTLLKRIIMATDAAYTRLYLLTPRKAFFTAPASQELLKQADTTKDIILRAKQFTTERGADFIVLSVPQLFQVLHSASGRSGDGIDPALTDDVFSEFSATHGINWVKALPILAETYRQNGVDLYHRFDGHLNATGNKLLADIAYDALKPMVSQ